MTLLFPHGLLSFSQSSDGSLAYVVHRHLTVWFPTRMAFILVTSPCAILVINAHSHHGTMIREGTKAVPIVCQVCLYWGYCIFDSSIHSSCISSFTICPLSMCAVPDSIYGPEKSHQVEDKIVFLYPAFILSCEKSVQFMDFFPHVLDFKIRQGHLTWSNVFSLHKQKWSDGFINVQLRYCVTVFVRTDN